MYYDDVNYDAYNKTDVPIVVFNQNYYIEFKNDAFLSKFNLLKKETDFSVLTGIKFISDYVKNAKNNIVTTPYKYNNNDDYMIYLQKSKSQNGLFIAQFLNKTSNLLAKFNDSDKSSEAAKNATNALITFSKIKQTLPSDYFNQHYMLIYSLEQLLYSTYKSCTQSLIVEKPNLITKKFTKFNLIKSLQKISKGVNKELKSETVLLSGPQDVTIIANEALLTKAVLYIVLYMLDINLNYKNIDISVHSSANEVSISLFCAGDGISINSQINSTFKDNLLYATEIINQHNGQIKQSISNGYRYNITLPILHDDIYIVKDVSDEYNSMNNINIIALELYNYLHKDENKSEF